MKCDDYKCFKQNHNEPVSKPRKKLHASEDLELEWLHNVNLADGLVMRNERLRKSPLGQSWSTPLILEGTGVMRQNGHQLLVFSSPKIRSRIYRKMMFLGVWINIRLSTVVVRLVCVLKEKWVENALHIAPYHWISTITMIWSTTVVWNFRNALAWRVRQDHFILYHVPQNNLWDLPKLLVRSKIFEQLSSLGSSFLVSVIVSRWKCF